MLATVAAMLILTGSAYAQTAGAKEAEKPTTDPTVVTAAETIASCVQATQKLGNNVIKENYLYAFEKMYPRYKKRQIALHGEKKFKQQFIDLPKTLNTMGVTITSFKAGEPVGVFRVWPLIKPDAKLKMKRGEQEGLQDGDVVYHRLMMVPTTQLWTFRNTKSGVPRILKREGFQIAIAKETVIPGQEEWTFIDGGTIKPQDLRAMFPSLPQKMVLPKRRDSEVK